MRTTPKYGAAHCHGLEAWMRGEVAAPVPGEHIVTSLRFLLVERFGTTLLTLFQIRGEVHDPRLAQAWASACEIVNAYERSPSHRRAYDEQTALVQMQTLHKTCTNRLGSLASVTFDLDDEDYEIHRVVADYSLLVKILALSLLEAGDVTGRRDVRECAGERLEYSSDPHVAHYARVYLGLSGDVGEPWRAGEGAKGALSDAIKDGQKILMASTPAVLKDDAERLRDRAVRADAGKEARDAQGGGDLDDDRAGLARQPGLAGLARTIPGGDPARPPLTRAVFPRMDHLPKPSSQSRDRVDSPRALCEGVIEVALPLSPTPDPKALADGLRAGYPWASEIIDLYATDLAGAPFAAFRPRIIVGGAGGGKTSFARALLRAAGLPETLYSAAGQMDGGSFAGTSRQWGTWRMSVAAQAVLRARLASVGIVVDEIEKAGPSRRWGRLDETLLPFLERGTTAKAIFDPAVEAPLDLSGVTYILTANDTNGLSGPLLDRAPAVRWPMPRAQDLPVVAAAILAELRREQGLDERWLPALDGDELDVLSGWKGGSMRPLRRMVQTVVAARDGYARRQPN